MPVLANARYERFAQIVADGKLTPTAAYRETLGADARDPDVNSCRWMKKPPIAKRIAELKAKAAEQACHARLTSGRWWRCMRPSRATPRWTTSGAPRHL